MGLFALLRVRTAVNPSFAGDNLIQESLWHLSEADLSNTSTAAMDVDSDQASKDAHALAKALRTLVSIVWENLSQEGRSVFHDFASFMRLALADAAEHVGDGARSAAEALQIGRAHV